MFEASIPHGLRQGSTRHCGPQGPRYTPEIRVDLPIMWEFEAFGRTDRFFDREKASTNLRKFA